LKTETRTKTKIICKTKIKQKRELLKPKGNKNRN